MTSGYRLGVDAGMGRLDTHRGKRNPMRVLVTSQFCHWKVHQSGKILLLVGRNKNNFMKKKNDEYYLAVAQSALFGKVGEV